MLRRCTRVVESCLPGGRFSRRGWQMTSQRSKKSRCFGKHNVATVTRCWKLLEHGKDWNIFSTYFQHIGTCWNQLERSNKSNTSPRYEFHTFLFASFLVTRWPWTELRDPSDLADLADLAVQHVRFEIFRRKLSLQRFFMIFPTQSKSTSQEKSTNQVQCQIFSSP